MGAEDRNDDELAALRARIEKVMQEKGLSARAWSLKAKLSHSFVESIRSGRSKSPELQSLRALAQAAEIDEDWFITGRRAIAVDERYEVMPAVRGMAKADRIPSEFVEKWETQLDYDGQPTADMLWTMLKASYQDYQLRRRASDEPLEGIDDVRTARKKK